MVYKLFSAVSTYYIKLKLKTVNLYTNILLIIFLTQRILCEKKTESANRLNKVLENLWAQKAIFHFKIKKA